jgi:hypothetical protein
LVVVLLLCVMIVIVPPSPLPYLPSQHPQNGALPANDFS